MPRRVVEIDRRNQTAKTGVRGCERELLEDIAEEYGITYSSVLYLAVVQFLRSERPEECEANGIRASLVGR